MKELSIFRINFYLNSFFQMEQHLVVFALYTILNHLKSF